VLLSTTSAKIKFMDELGRGCVGAFSEARQVSLKRLVARPRRGTVTLGKGRGVPKRFDFRTVLESEARTEVDCRSRAQRPARQSGPSRNNRTMRLRKIRFRIRTLLLLVALVALGLFAQRIYRDGPEAHWLVLKLRYGNVAMRRSAALQARESEGRAMFLDLIARASRQTSDPQLRRRQRGAGTLRSGVPPRIGVREESGPAPAPRGHARRG
jgi:hypothetical protein